VGVWRAIRSDAGSARLGWHPATLRLVTEEIAAVGHPVEESIVVVRGQRIMLDADLAALYGVETKVLLQAVRRNADRFPDDFMFQLTAGEYESLRSQSVTSNAGRGGRRYRPYAFTEQGVAMLSSVLRSPRAVLVNIEIMRAFVRLRRLIVDSAELGRRMAELEQRYEDHDEQLRAVFQAIRELMAPTEQPRKRIGFKP
jgi:hypothetical protein